MTRLHIVMGPGQAVDFLGMVRTGVTVAVRVGCSVADLLVGRFGLDETYVTRRITTIFLDGKPVDAVGSARARDGATLALSAAMPGLAGAILRCDGALSSLRGAITYRDAADAAPEREGAIRVKLFNLLAPELAPVLLRRGVLLPVPEAERFFRERSPSFWNGCREILLEGERIGPERLIEGGWASCTGPVRFSVRMEEG